jgi:hypothetical protein
MLHKKRPKESDRREGDVFDDGVEQGLYFLLPLPVDEPEMDAFLSFSCVTAMLAFLAATVFFELPRGLRSWVGRKGKGEQGQEGSG